MKFKRFLASVLSALMLVSCMSFVAHADDTATITFNTYNGNVDVTGGKVTANRQLSTATVNVGDTITFPADPSYAKHTFKGWSLTENGEVVDKATEVAAGDATYYAVWEQTTISDTPIFAQNVSENNSKYMNGEGCGNITTLYDATADVVFKRFRGSKDSNFNAYLNMYGLGTDSIYSSQSKLYFISYYRTNIDGGTPYADFYNTSTKKGDYKTFNGARDAAKVVGDQTWRDETIRFDNMANLGRCTQVAFRIVGDKPMMKNDGKWFDVAGVYGFESQNAMEAFEADYSLKGVSVTFDVQLTDDDDTDVYDEYPADVENDGNALVGWTLDPNADEVEFIDITAMAVPTEDVTLYAVWNEERTINFYKNDGTNTVETLVLGKGAAVTVPDFSIDGKLFMGWADAEGNPVEVQTTVEENADYYAIWKSLWLTGIVVNGNNYNDSKITSGKWYGITENITTLDSLEVVMPYGYNTDYIPTIAATPNAGTAVYTAPASFDEEGEIVITNGSDTKTIPVAFTVADRDSVSDITRVPVSISDDGKKNVGAATFKENTEKGISATKFVPITSTDSEYYVASNEKGENGLLPNKSTTVQGFGLYEINYESYEQFRFLIYYDDAGTGIDRDDKTLVNVYVAPSHAKGTVSNKTFSQSSGPVKANRWQYVYVNLPEFRNDEYIYGYAKQLLFNFFGGGVGSNIKDDCVYVASMDLLVDADEKFLQYEPTGLVSTNETSAKNDGTISGVNADMEISVNGGEYVAVADFDGYADGVITGLAPATYTLRYAETETHAASDEVEVLIAPDSVEIYFDYDDGSQKVEQVYAYNDAIEAPARVPAKKGYEFVGWALDGEIYDFTDAIAKTELDGAVFTAVFERASVIYVNGSAAANGDGTSKDSPLTSLADAWSAVSDIDSTIIITGDTKLMGKLHANGGNVTIKGLTGEEVLIHSGPDFNGTNPGKVTFENITIKNGTEWSNFWLFKGMEVEFGEGINVPVDKTNGWWPIVARAGGESGATLGRKIIIRSGTFKSFFLGSKNACTNGKVDFEFYGGTGSIVLGNDNVSGGTIEANGAVMTDINTLFEVAPSGISLGWVKQITGALQIIANNGTVLPEFSLGSIVPAGGDWRINSAEGGRVDFTEAAGTFKVTSDKTYAVFTDAEGNATKYRVSDGASDEASLYGEDSSFEVTLPAGVYAVTYTDEGLSVTGKFVTSESESAFEISASNDYSVAIPEEVIEAAKADAAAGYKFSGEFESADGAYKTVDGVLTVTEYTADVIELFPTFVEDDTAPYYHAEATFNKVLGTYDLTIAIANGKYVAGTVGIEYDADALEFAGETLGEEIGNILGSTPEIVKNAPESAVVLVWNAAEGSIDATENDVEIVTLNFTVKDAEAVGATTVKYYVPDVDYANYFEEGYYKASPMPAEGDDAYEVKYVSVFASDILFTEQRTDPATITVKVTMPEKAGATTDNIAYLSYFNDNDVYYIALEEEGNTEKTIEVEIADVFHIGEVYNFTIVKNGYTGSDVVELTVEDGMVIESTILAGDIKESFTGSNAEIVDPDDFGDGDITLADFVRVVRGFDEAATDEYKTVVDINEDGTVNVTDISAVKANFGKSYTDAELIVSYND